MLTNAGAGLRCRMGPILSIAPMARTHPARPNRAPHSSRRPSRHAVRTQAPPRTRGKTILVYEDHASVGGLISALLRQEGYRAVRAWDLPEALRLARGRAPDLLLLDLNLTYAAGIAPLHALRGHEATAHIPVVVVSGATALSSEERELVSDVVPKPFDIDIMLNAVRKAVGDPVVDVPPRNYGTQDSFLHGY